MFSNNVFLNVLAWVGIVLGDALALFIAWYIISWLFLGAVSLTINMKKEYNKPNSFYKNCMDYAYVLIFVLFRISYKATGLEKIPTGKRFLFVSNHCSKFDNMVHALCMKKEKLAFLSKKENFKIILARRYIQANGYLSLDRGNIKSSIYNINRACNFIKNDITSVGVFPEGTRSKDGFLLPFHPGTFKIAERTKCPIVVGITHGTEKIHTNWPLKHTKVTFDVIKVIESEEYEGKKTTEISSIVRKLMLESLGQEDLYKEDVHKNEQQTMTSKDS